VLAGRRHEGRGRTPGRLILGGKGYNDNDNGKDNDNAIPATPIPLETSMLWDSKSIMAFVKTLATKQVRRRKQSPNVKVADLELFGERMDQRMDVRR